MDATGDVRSGMARGFAGFSIFFFLFMGAPADGKGLYTRTDQLSCGNTSVRAFTTCTEESEDVPTAACTEQHFLFRNETTGVFVKVEASGKPVHGRNRKGGGMRTRLRGLAVDWACLDWGSGSYVVIMYAICGPETRDNRPWDEIFDLKSRRLASSEGPDERKAWEKFRKKWNSLDLPPGQWPIDEFISIQLFKTDRR